MKAQNNSRDLGGLKLHASQFPPFYFDCLINRLMIHVTNVHVYTLHNTRQLKTH